jgi:pyridoxamine 5'-phosphate oxidase
MTTHTEGIPPTEWSVQSGLLPADPLALLRRWMPADDDPDRPVATLATVDETGAPDVRGVLLSSYRDGVATFHTDVRSRKAAQLHARPAAAVLLAWSAKARQLVMRGSTTVSSREEQAAAYARRTRYLQLLAWENSDATAELDRRTREQRWAEFDRSHPQLEPPSTWIGFALTASELTFWEGSQAGPSRRAQYLLRNGNWMRAWAAG